MILHRIALSVALAALVGSALNAPSLAADAVPQYVSAAIADPGRPPWEIKMDGDRKPGEIMAFSGVRPGAIVGELIPNYGYYTRILAKLVHPGGRVYAVVPSGGGGGRELRVAQRLGKAPAAIPDELAQACVRGCYEEGMAPYMIPIDHILAIQNISEYNNMTALWVGLGAYGGEFPLPEQADIVFSDGGYHQLHAKDAKLNVVNVDKAILRSLKPGGVFVVSDSIAAPGTVFETAAVLKRSDPEAVKAEILQAGFMFDGESKVLANASDNHAKPADDKSLRYKTDRYLLRFKKPENMTGDKRPPANTTAGFYGNTQVVSLGSKAGGTTPGPRERREFYAPDGPYHEFGYIGKGPAPMQAGIWYWDADGHNCQLHQFPIDERAVVVCHDYIEPHKVGDTWFGGDGQRPHQLLQGYQTPEPPPVD